MIFKGKKGSTAMDCLMAGDMDCFRRKLSGYEGDRTALLACAVFLDVVWARYRLDPGDFQSAVWHRILEMAWEYSYAESRTLKKAIAREMRSTQEKLVFDKETLDARLNLAALGIFYSMAENPVEGERLLRKALQRVGPSAEVKVLVPTLRYHLGRCLALMGDNSGLKNLRKAAGDLMMAGDLAAASAVLVEAVEYALDYDQPEMTGEILEQLKICSKRSGSSLSWGLYHHLLGRRLLLDGRPEAALKELKASLNPLERALGRSSKPYIDSRIHILSIYLDMDKRRRAKKELLSIVTTLPVKQYAESYRLLKNTVFDYTWLREDSDTAFLFEGEKRRTIKREVIEAILEEARKSHPYEFGALLKGVDNITELVFVPGTSRGRHTVVFQLYYNPYGGDRVEGDGVAHSHPSGSARPSKADLFMFSRFPGVNIIVAFPYTMDSWAAYDPMGNRVKLEVVD